MREESIGEQEKFTKPEREKDNTVSLDSGIIYGTGLLDLLAAEVAWQVTVARHADVGGVEKLLRRRSWAADLPKRAEAEEDAECRRAEVWRRADECDGIATDRKNAVSSAGVIRLTADPATELCEARAAIA